MTVDAYFTITPVRICEHCQDNQKEAFPYGAYDPSGRYWEILCNECFDTLGCLYPNSEGYDDWDDHDSTCLTCGGTGIIITCMDDICVGGNHCIHGDGEAVCPECGGGY